MILIEAGALSMLLIEGLKWITAKIRKEPDFNFPPVMFKVGVPILNAIMPFFLVYILGQPVDDPILTLDILGVLRYTATVAVSSLISFVSYDAGLKPLKEYTASY
jgi:hypothetical protein